MITWKPPNQKTVSEPCFFRRSDRRFGARQREGFGFRVPDFGFRLSGIGVARPCMTRRSGRRFVGQRRASEFGFRVSGIGGARPRYQILEIRFRVSGLLYLVFSTGLVANSARDEKLSRQPHAAHLSGTKSSFSTALMCTTCRQIPASSSTHRGAKKGDLI